MSQYLANAGIEGNIACSSLGVIGTLGTNLFKFLQLRQRQLCTMMHGLMNLELAFSIIPWCNKSLTHYIKYSHPGFIEA